MADDSEWIEWAGGECPVQRCARGFLKYRDGEVRPMQDYHCVSLFWAHTGSNCDIIAYRVVQS